MNILILSLCCNSENPLRLLYKTQRETWDEKEEPCIKTLFYEGGSKEDYCMSRDLKLLKVPAIEDGKHLGLKLRLALDFVWNWSWDFVLRSNNSSYVDKKLLKTIATTLPSRNCYAGSVGLIENEKDLLHVNGGGIWLSRDTADLLRKELQDEEQNSAEDTNIGKLFHAHGITAFKVGRGNMPCDRMKDVYLYRCQNYKKDPNRQVDIDYFLEIQTYKDGLL